MAAGPYAGVLRAVLLAHKDGATALAGPLGSLLAAAVDRTVEPGVPVLLVPVPSSRRAVRERGHDHALQLARRAARDLRVRGRPAAVRRGLRQRRGVQDQGSLDAAGRAANLRGALAVRAPSRLAAEVRAGAALLVVDDVCASGATLTECAATLAAAGVPVRAAVVVAATALRASPSQRGTSRGAAPDGPLSHEDVHQD